RAHAAPAGNRRLTHGDTFLAGAVVIRAVSDADLRRRLDDRREKRIARLRVGHAQRALPATECVVALAGIALHALEDRQDVMIAPTTVAHLRPGIEVLGLAADKHHSVDRAGAAKQFASRHREPAAIGACLRLLAAGFLISRAMPIGMNDQGWLGRPASSNNTLLRESADSRFATAAPAEPAPTTM